MKNRTHRFDRSRRSRSHVGKLYKWEGRGQNGIFMELLKNYCCSKGSQINREKVLPFKKDHKKIPSNYRGVNILGTNLKLIMLFLSQDSWPNNRWNRIDLPLGDSFILLRHPIKSNRSINKIFSVLHSITTIL